MSRFITLVLTVFVVLFVAGFQSTVHAQIWRLEKIEASMAGFGAPRLSKVLPVETREKKGTFWQNRQTAPFRKLEMDITFKDLPEVMKPGLVSIPTGAHITAVINGPGPASATMVCGYRVTTPSGYEGKEPKALNSLSYEIPSGAKEKTSMYCGASTISMPPKEDFVLTLTVQWWDGSSRMFQPGDTGDLTFHFFYKWGGGEGVGNGGGGSCFENNGAGSTDRNDHYTWAKEQGTETLESDLKEKASIVFGCSRLTSDKLTSVFADVSVIIANWVTKASCFGGDDGATNTDWNAHKNWGAGQSKSALLSNLHGKLSAAMECLSREKQDSFFADVSVAFAKGAS